MKNNDTTQQHFEIGQTIYRIRHKNGQIAVEKFVSGEIKYTEIFNFISNALEKIPSEYCNTPSDLLYFIKKIRKMNNLSPNFEMILISKSFSEEFEEKLKSCSTTKFINWLF